MEENEHEILKDILNSMPDDFRVIEQGINDGAASEYYEVMENLDGFVTEDEVLEQAVAWNENVPIKESKELLGWLSETISVEGFRAIERIIDTTTCDEIRQFGYVALRQARLFLENTFSDEPVGFVSTGLGGVGNRLRYHIVLQPKTDIFTNEHERTIRQSFDHIGGKRSMEIEEMENRQRYVGVVLLASMDEAIGHIIDDLLGLCEFVAEGYMSTNVQKINEDTILGWLNGEIDIL